MLNGTITIMFVGMGVVFVFLLLIVCLINAMSFVLKYFPEPCHAAQTANGFSSSLEEIAVLIAAAKSLSERK